MDYQDCLTLTFDTASVLVKFHCKSLLLKYMGGKEILLNVLWDLRQTVVVQKYRRVYVWLDGVNKPFFFYHY